MNKISLKKIISFFILITLFTIILLINTNFKRFLDNELQVVLSKKKTISSIYQLFDQGDLFYESVWDKEKIKLTNFSRLIQLSNFKKNNFNIETLEIYLKFEDLNQIYNDRKLALIRDINYNPKRVLCYIKHNNKIYKCRIRLKGDLKDHFNSSIRFSLSVQIIDGFINGLNEFSINKPRARMFPYDMIYQKLITSLGNISSDGHFFYNIKFNGENWGTMLIEESINKNFFKKRNLKQSQTYRIWNDDKWAFDRMNKNNLDFFLSDPSITLDIKGNKKKIFKDKQELEIYSKILNEIKNKNGEIFDRNMMLRNLITSLIWGDNHTLGLNNTYFAWNYNTQKLEPISSDQGPWSIIDEDYLINYLAELPFTYFILFKDKPLKQLEFKNVFNQVVSKIDEKNVLNEINSIKKKYFPHDELFIKTPFKHNINVINQNVTELVKKINNYKFKTENKEKLNKEQLKSLPQFVEFIHYSDGSIEIFNLLNEPIKVVEINNKNKIYSVNKEIKSSRARDLSSIKINSVFENFSGDVKVTAYSNGISKITTNEIALINIEKNSKLSSD